jgi:predicted ribosomally synthesized peptide with SipW-like signal peptide
MNAKRLILSLGMLVFVGAAVVGGTGAFFSDTETSTGNVFAAGEVNIEIDDIIHDGNNEDEVVGFTTSQDGMSFAFADLKPLDTGTVTFSLDNTGNPVRVCAMVDQTADNENVIIEPEEGDLTENDGELDNFLTFKFGNETGTLADAEGEWVFLADVAANTPANSSFGYCFGQYDGNDCELGAGNYNLAQTDSLVADVKFYAIQTRNNENFSCASLNEPEGPQIDEGATEFEFSGGVRYRELLDSAQEQEIYLGKSDLGVGGNRVAAHYDWPSTPGTQSFNFAYNSGTDSFTSDLGNLNYGSVSTQVCSPNDMDVIQVLVRTTADATVNVSNFTVDGVNFGTLVGTTGGANWTVSNIDATDGITVTGSIDTTGTLNGSAESQKVEILVGCSL